MHTTNLQPHRLHAPAVTEVEASNLNAKAVHLGWLMNLSSWLRYVVALLLPLAFFKGTWESSTAWADVPQPLSTSLAYFAFLPLVVMGFVADVLCFNQSYFSKAFQRRVTSPWLGFLQFAAEIVLCALALVCCWAVGVVWFHVWVIMHGWGALCAAILGLLILLGLYMAVTSHHQYPTNCGEAVYVGESHAPSPTAPASMPSEISNAEKDLSVDDSLDFEWKWPSKRLDSLAGMADLKSTLYEVLAGLKNVAQGAAVERNGILLSGPPGNGKSTVAACISAELGLPMITVGAAELTSMWVNESPQKIKALFKTAARRPCVVFIDEFDSVGQSRGNGHQHGEDRKVVNTLLAQIDSARNSPIILIAATNFPEQLDTALVRDGRFDFRIEIPLPDSEARFGILRECLGQLNVLAPNPTLKKIANLWERRPVSFIKSCALQVRDAVRQRGDYVACLDDFKEAAYRVSRKSTALAPPGPKLDEIFLPGSVKKQMAGLVFRLQNWESISERGGEAPSGVLLYGPPGTGKTHLVQSLARELDWHLFEIRGSAATRDPDQLRATIELAYTHRPALVFLDEADEVLADRSTALANGACNELLKMMDGAGGKVPEVLFVAATNRMEAIDPAALRPGRFGEKIYMGPLTGDDLVNFFTLEFRKKERVQFSQDLTPQALATLLSHATPAYASAVLRMAVNLSFNDGNLIEGVGLNQVHAAIETLGANL